jgi:Flp pilus assembly protein TadD
MGQYEQAIEDLGQAVLLNPQESLAYANRARAHTLLGQDTEAQQDLEKAVELGFDRESVEVEINRLKSQR